MRRFAALLALAVALSAAATSPTLAAPRGPSTQAERDKVVALVKVLETTPWSEEATQARGWLQTFLDGVPDVTVKTCRSLLGSPSQRQGIASDLLDQVMFSGAGHLMQHPEAGAGSTETLLAALNGTLDAYTAWKAHDDKIAHPRLDELLATRANGQLEAYVRAQARACL